LRSRTTARYPPTGSSCAASGTPRGSFDSREHEDEDEEGRGVEQEQAGEAARIRGRRDQAADEAAEADAEVHADPLEREGGVAVLVRRQPREEGRLAGPEARRPDALQPEQRECLPRLADQREHRERGGLQQEPEQQRVAPADVVDRPAGAEAGDERRDARERQRESGLGERDPAHVVQVDDDERDHDPVPECVHDAADLDEPDRSREVRVEPAEIRSQRFHRAF
jgi:hypothetical protein